MDVKLRQPLKKVEIESLTSKTVEGKHAMRKSSIQRKQQKRKRETF